MLKCISMLRYCSCNHSSNVDETTQLCLTRILLPSRSVIHDTAAVSFKSRSAVRTICWNSVIGKIFHFNRPRRDRLGCLFLVRGVYIYSTFYRYTAHIDRRIICGKGTFRSHTFLIFCNYFASSDFSYRYASFCLDTFLVTLFFNRH